MAMQIGFIGLGHMGLPMAVNLVKKGYEVTGYDISAAAKEAFAKEGGQIADGLEDVARDKAVVITMLQTPEQVLETCLGEHGIFKQMPKGALYIDCSTIGVDAVCTLHQEAPKYGLESLESPVSGGVRGAVLGTLTLMVGGVEALFAAHQPLLSCLGTTIIYTGGPGSGQAAKLCNNMILGISMVAVSEAFLLAERLGLSPKKLHEVVTQSSGQCWAMSVHTPLPGIVQSPANNQYQPGFSSKMMLKDLRLSQQAALSVGFTTTLGAEATALYEKEESKIGDLDFSAIVTCLQ